MENFGFLYVFGLLLIVFGVFIIVLAILVGFSSKRRRARIEGGGVIMVGPVPIIFGSSKKAVKTVVLLAITLTVIWLVTIIVSYFLR